MTQKKLTVLDLFSGIGGFSLGLERAGFQTIAFCEIEPFCRKVLGKHWQNVPIAEDIHQLSYEDGILYDAGRAIYEGRIDLICGGFPCQPFSVAGRKKGTEDNRDLWPQMFRIIQQAQPTWVIGENVANFANMAFTRSKVDLESEGYAVQPFIIPACAIGAPHRRDRIWIIAHSKSKQTGGQEQRGLGQNSASGTFASNLDGKRCEAGCNNRGAGRILHDEFGNASQGERTRQGRQCRINEAGEIATHDGSKRIQGSKSQSLCGEQAFSWCKDVRRLEDYFNRPDIPQPLICRSGDGFSHRMDRLRALGNAVVPQIPEIIGRAILDSMKARKSHEKEIFS